MNGLSLRYTYLYILFILNSNYCGCPFPQQLEENKTIWSQGVYRYWRNYFVFEGREENFV